MRNLDHPNVVKLVEFSEARQYYYIVLELCPGGELFHQIVRLTYFSEDLSRHVITQVANALEYLHEEAGVVHRSVFFQLQACKHADIGAVTSNPKICCFTRRRLFRPETQSLEPRKTRTRPTKVNSSKVSALVELVSSRLQISVFPK